MNDNTELLEWAVETIEEWEAKSTHLRGDDSINSVFYTSGDNWSSEAIGLWEAGEDDYRIVPTKKKFGTPQVITKEEWVEAKNRVSNNTSDFKGSNTTFTKDDLKVGEHIVKLRNGNEYLVLANNILVNLDGTSWIDLQYYDHDLKNNKVFGRVRRDVVSVYSLVEGCPFLGLENSDKRGLIWEREPVDEALIKEIKESIQRAEKALQKAQEDLESAQQELEKLTGGN